MNVPSEHNAVELLVLSHASPTHKYTQPKLHQMTIAFIHWQDKSTRTIVFQGNSCKLPHRDFSSGPCKIIISRPSNPSLPPKVCPSTVATSAQKKERDAKKVSKTPHMYHDAKPNITLPALNTGRE
jgi:hypothetical protein